MSIKCQLQVIENHDNENSKITLYCFKNGYPRDILKKMYQAYKYEEVNCILDKVVAGKVASLICWTDPTNFEVENSHKLHDDIEYYYRLFCRYSFKERKVIWEVEISVADWSRDLETHRKKKKRQKVDDCFFLDNWTENLLLVEDRQPIESLLKEYA